jgi:hypothetical protein
MALLLLKSAGLLNLAAPVLNDLNHVQISKVERLRCQKRVYTLYICHANILLAVLKIPLNSEWTWFLKKISVAAAGLLCAGRQCNGPFQKSGRYN